MLRTTLTLTLLLPAAAGAAVPPRFDLACQDSATTTARGIAPVVKAGASGMSIDLTRRRWCWHKGTGCLQVLAIRAVQGDRLLLRNERGVQGSAVMLLDLASGVYRSQMHIVAPGVAPLDATERGTCRIVPFTHLP